MQITTAYLGELGLDSYYRRKQMGRPLKKDRMSGLAGAFGGTGIAGNLAVTAYRPFGGSKVDSTVAYVVSQRATNLYKVHLEDSTEVVMQLKAVAPGTLAANNASGHGEFCVQMILDDSTVAYVSKFFNNTVHYKLADGTTGTVKYTLGSEGTDETKADTVASGLARTGTIDVR